MKIKLSGLKQIIKEELAGFNERPSEEEIDYYLEDIVTYVAQDVHLAASELTAADIAGGLATLAEESNAAVNYPEAHRYIKELMFDEQITMVSDIMDRLGVSNAKDDPQ